MNNLLQKTLMNFILCYNLWGFLQLYLNSISVSKYSLYCFALFFFYSVWIHNHNICLYVFHSFVFMCFHHLPLYVPIISLYVFPSFVFMYFHHFSLCFHQFLFQFCLNSVSPFCPIFLYFVPMLSEFYITRLFYASLLFYSYNSISHLTHYDSLPNTFILIYNFCSTISCTKCKFSNYFGIFFVSLAL